MKKFIFLLFSIFSFFVFFRVQAQDIIIKKNAEEIPAKVLEVEIEVIKYKRQDNLEGPVISISKADVFMIKYANGTKEVFNAAPANTTNNKVQEPPIIEMIRLNGPRLGFTVVTGRLADRLDDRLNAGPVLSQFGWQFETRLFTTDNGTSGLFEFIPLIGGLEQGKFLPSLNGLIGLRGAKGLEFGVGPNVSVAGAALAFAFGTTFQARNINYPVNVAVVPGNQGLRFSLLVGFNARRN